MSSKVLEGSVKRHPDGFGFLIPDLPDQPDVYIPRHSMEGVMSNDRVQVKVTQERGGERFRGEVIAVLSRSVNRVMGQFIQHRPGYGLLVDKSFGWGADLKVEVPAGLQVKDKDWVAAEITSYPDSPEGFKGRVVALIGDMENPQNDSLRALHSHAIPFEFTKATLAESEKFEDEVNPADFSDRRDLTQTHLITIDGATAKDFDDAIFVETSGRGFRLVVAIADVSHYVKEDTAIDKDAVERGNSTYFPNFVAPMLPEKLSNGLCSLKPNVFRAAFVADMEISFDGEITKSEFYEALIKSHARVTYGEAQEVIDGVTPEKFKHVEQDILKARDLAKVLMAKRFREGALDLDLPETEIELDEAGFPVDILQSERLFSHRLIEEMMLTANVAVARFFKEREIDALYRIHDEPKGEAIENLQNYLNAFGYNENVKAGALQKKLSRALEHFQGHPKETIVSSLVLRSLAQAKYAAINVGHFGLAFEDYTHFTSPIRRYSDLIVHRLMKALLYPKKGYRLLSQGELETLGTMLSACEQRSVKAERQVKAIKKARFMSKFIGQHFEGIVTSVAKFGVFVQLRQYDVDGLIKIDMLGPGRYDFDPELLVLVDRRTKGTIEIGQPMAIQVVRVDIEAGQVDFMPVKSEINGGKDLSRQERDSFAEEDRVGKIPKGKDLFGVRQFPSKNAGGKKHGKKRGGKSGSSKKGQSKTQSGSKPRSSSEDRGGSGKKRVSRSHK